MKCLLNVTTLQVKTEKPYPYLESGLDKFHEQDSQYI